VRSAFDLPAEERATIQNALNETFSAEVRVRFETAPDLVSGIELTSNGQKVAWSIADYLASLEQGVGELLKEQEKAEVKAEPKPEPKAAPKPETEAKAKPTPEAAPPVPAKTEPEAVPKPAAKAEPPPEESKAAPVSP
jgi:F-type H+-transporting ATPase subunit b